ncbi:MAG: hypothetical protein M3O31_09005 [Acidobacteriota bacterium]|nr:hypothetical protein [Acidobacteriota bacterium]
MKIKTGAENRRQMILASVVGVMALGACVYIYEELFAGSAPPPATTAQVSSVPVAPVRTETAAPAVTAGKPARSLGTTSAALDPSLHMDAMLVSEQVQYAGSGRNIFSPNSAPPVVIPKPLANARVVAPPPPIPCPPNCPVPVVQPPPPIDLKFWGTVENTPSGARKALLLHGEDVFVASAGEIVMRRYRVIAVNARTIEVEDMQNNNKQTLPLLLN